MTRATDAQARLLALVQEHEPVFVGDGGNVWQTGSLDGTRWEGILPSDHTVQFPKGRARPATVAAVLRNGWLDRNGDQLAWLSADGAIALGLWRQRKMAAPPAPAPQISGDDLAVLSLAAEARRLGYCIAPQTPDARKQARRLARDRWVERGWVSSSTRSLLPTAMGEVAAFPERADVA